MRGGRPVSGGPTVRIDAHHHVWNLSVRPQPWIDPVTMATIHRSFAVEHLVPHLDAHGIDRTVVVQTVTEADETPELVALAAAEVRVGAVVGWVDLTAEDVADTVAALQALPGGGALRGVRHQVQGEHDPRWTCRPDVRRGLAAVADAGLLYELLVLPHQLPAAVETVAAVPQCTFVLDHLGKPPVASGALEPWASHLRALAALPNVVAKVSGLVTEAAPGWEVRHLAPYVDVALEAFGPHRLMAGSDWPVCLLAASYDEVAAATGELLAALDGNERAAVLGGTAARVYGIDDAGPPSP